MKKITRTLLLGVTMVGLGAPAAMAQQRGARGQQARQAQQTRGPQTGRSTRTTAPRTGRLAAAFGRGQRTQAGTSSMRPQAQAEIAAYTQHMTAAIQRNATPPMALINMTSGARMTQVRQGSYKQNITPKYKVDAPGGNITLAALLPVSGHVGQANAANYAKTNNYNVEVHLADGTVQRTKVKSTGFVTPTELNIQLKKGTNYVRMWADGSGGVGGFKSGREVELDYDGN